MFTKFVKVEKKMIFKFLIKPFKGEEVGYDM